MSELRREPCPRCGRTGGLRRVDRYGTLVPLASLMEVHLLVVRCNFCEATSEIPWVGQPVSGPGEL